MRALQTVQNIYGCAHYVNALYVWEIKEKITQAGDARIDRIGSALANLPVKCSRQGSQGSLHDN